MPFGRPKIKAKKMPKAMAKAMAAAATAKAKAKAKAAAEAPNASDDEGDECKESDEDGTWNLSLPGSSNRIWGLLTKEGDEAIAPSATLPGCSNIPRHGKEDDESIAPSATLPGCSNTPHHGKEDDEGVRLARLVDDSLMSFIEDHHDSLRSHKDIALYLVISELAKLPGCEARVGTLSVRLMWGQHYLDGFGSLRSFLRSRPEMFCLVGPVVKLNVTHL